MQRCIDKSGIAPDHDLAQRHALTERTVDSHVKLLRRKLDEGGAPASLVQAVRGVGFKLSDAP